METAADHRSTRVARWVLTFFVGCVVALVATCIIYCARQLIALRFTLVYELVAAETAGTHHKGVAFLTFFAIGLGYALVAALPVVFIETSAGSSGIPEIKMILNGVKMPRVTRFRTLACRVFGNIFSVASGLPVGYEGPMISIGGAIAAGLSQGKSTTLGFDTRWSVYSAFRNDAEKRDFIVCGAGAGVAAAFNAPIGGVLFSYEESASFWSKSLMWRAFFCAIVAAYVIAVFMSGINDRAEWGQLSSPGMFTWGSFSEQNASHSWGIWEIPLFLLLGAGGGLVGALFVAVNRLASRLRGRLVNRSRARRLVDVALMHTLVSLLAFGVPLLLGVCSPLPAADSDGGSGSNGYASHLVQFYCPVGQFNDLASFWFTPTEDAIRLFFHLPPGDAFNVARLAVFASVYTLLMCLCAGASVPSGLFIPTMLAGSALGRLAGEGANMLLPPNYGVDAGTYALLGAAALLGGTTRMAISLAAILLQCTGNYEYMLPITATLMVSRWVGNLFNHGMYDMQIHLKRRPLLEDGVPKAIANELRVCDVMSQEVLVLQEVERVGRVHDLLTSSRFSGFPVVFSEGMLASHPRLGTLAGYIQRKHLAVLLGRRAFHAGLPGQQFARVGADAGHAAACADAPTERVPYGMIFTAAKPPATAGGSRHAGWAVTGYAGQPQQQQQQHGEEGDDEVDAEGVPRPRIPASLMARPVVATASSQQPAAKTATRGAAFGSAAALVPVEEEEDAGASPVRAIRFAAPSSPAAASESQPAIPSADTVSNANAILAARTGRGHSTFRQIRLPPLARGGAASAAASIPGTGSHAASRFAPPSAASASSSSSQAVPLLAATSAADAAAAFRAPGAAAISLNSSSLNTGGNGGGGYLRASLRLFGHAPDAGEVEAAAAEAQTLAAAYNTLYYDGSARYADEPLLLWGDLEAAYPRYPCVDAMAFTPEERGMYIDLRPYMDPTPLTVHVHTPLVRAFRLYREMGLRHLLAVNNSADVVGVVSRSNLTGAALRAAYEAATHASAVRRRVTARHERLAPPPPHRIEACSRRGSSPPPPG